MSSPRPVSLLLIPLLCCSLGCSQRAQPSDASVYEDSAREADSSGDTAADDGVGFLDGFTVCAQSSLGPQPLQRRRSTNGDWHLALAPSARYRPLTMVGAKGKEAAATIDYEGGKEQVAGFVLSMPARLADLAGEVAALISRVKAKPPGKGSVAVRFRGTRGKSHERYDTIRGVTLDLGQPDTDVATARNELVAAILGRSPGALGALPPPFGGKGLVMTRLSVIRRVAFARDGKGKLVLDAAGHPVEDLSRADQRRVLVMGAVALEADYAAPLKRTGIIVDDLSGGTGLASRHLTTHDGCDTLIVDELPTADIIWVVDESDSMTWHREALVNGARALFARATAAGVDFRMGVTNVCRADAGRNCVAGKFCSRSSFEFDDDGGVDRFLLPNEWESFEACIENPPGGWRYAEYGLQNARAAVERHLPRAAGVPNKLRPDAATAIIIVSDQWAEVVPQMPQGCCPCTLPADSQSKLDSALSPYLDFFRGAQVAEAAATVHVIGGVCGNSCGAAVAHGYRDLAQRLGGHVADICNKDIGDALQPIVDSLVAGTRPLELEHRPIASTLTVSLDGVVIERSRSKGFDYRPESNRLVLVDTKHQNSEIVVGYKRWAEAN